MAGAAAIESVSYARAGGSDGIGCVTNMFAKGVGSDPNPMKVGGFAITAPEFAMPSNLAKKQHETLLSCIEKDPRINEMMNDQFIRYTVVRFHPDFVFDQKTRKLLHINHPSHIWLQWENLVFEPTKYQLEHQLFMAYCESGGADLWAYAAYDLRNMAVFTTAAMCLYEYARLRDPIDPVVSPESTTVACGESIAATRWRHLYWFTRFYQAWVRIMNAQGYQDAKVRERLGKTRVWKQAAWDHYIEYMRQNPNAKLNAAVLDFLGKFQTGVNYADVHKWITKRKNKSLGGTIPQNP